MTASRLRARLDRLAPLVVPQPIQDRNRARQRRDVLSYRKLLAVEITEGEQAELLELQALFHDEDRDRARLHELDGKQFSAEHSGAVPLTDIETRELAELNRRFPAHANHPLKVSIEAWGRAAAGS